MRHIIPLLTLALLIALLPGVTPARVRASADQSLHVVAEAGDVRLSWRGAVTADDTGAPTVAGWPRVAINGTLLPATLVALRVTLSALAPPQVEQLASVDWPGALPAAPGVIPQTLAGEARPALARHQPVALPDSPVVVVSDALERGTRIVVLAVSPLFSANGMPRAATALEVRIANVTLLGAEDTPLATPAHASLSRLADVIAPSTITTRAVAMVRVTRFGLQRLSGAALATAGIASAAPASIHLYHSRAEVAIEERGTADGTLDPGDELRFFAPTPGDRWNKADTYWLVIEARPGLRMATRSAAPRDAPLRTTALERGTWHHNALYDSLLPGVDGDHWYAADLKTAPEQPPATLIVPLTPTLALVPGTTTLTVTGSAYNDGDHALAVQLGASSQQALWRGVGSWTRRFSLAATGDTALLSLLPRAAPDGVEADVVVWERPASLDFAGQGAAFAGIAGSWRYQLSNLPLDHTLYDISDARAPNIVATPSGANAIFEDGPAAHSYLLAGPGTLATPAVEAHRPSDLASPLNADVLYIAPAPFTAALGPLVGERQAQGHSVRVIDVQAIYDAWSEGQVAPTAIRAFLRYAAATWSKPPLAVTLVGDGTSDPHDYTGYHNPTFIPPYLAPADPWLGETACEQCYAQLDGDDPLLDPLPDLMLGRLPVKSVEELTVLVAKLLRYESGTTDGAWQGRAVFIADNYRAADSTPDGAGDFAAQADASIGMLPVGIESRRLYYDPAPTASEPWREPDARRARERTLGLLNAGAGIVTYVGHAHQWQWAVTDPAAAPDYLLGLYDTDDLTNGVRLPIVLELTCLTSAFQTPAVQGTSIDERLLLAQNGGAVAVWGSTGLGVGHGHAALERGFGRALWAAAPQTATVGALTMAGYQELFATSPCCYDALHTYALLGDPLTPARVVAGQPIYLPIVRK